MKTRISKLDMKKTTDRHDTDGNGDYSRVRRQFLRWGGAGLALGLAPGAIANHDSDTPFEIYDETTRLELKEDGDRIIENAYHFGYRFHKEHGGCARCTVAALQNALEMVPEHPGLFRASTCLDAGASPGRDLSCGCFTGAGIVIGYICGGKNFESRELAHHLILKVAEIFRENYGSVLCRDAIEHNDCSDLVGLTSKWTAEILLKQFSDYKG